LVLGVLGVRDPTKINDLGLGGEVPIKINDLAQGS